MDTSKLVPYGSYSTYIWPLFSTRIYDVVQYDVQVEIYLTSQKCMCSITVLLGLLAHSPVKMSYSVRFSDFLKGIADFTFRLDADVLPNGTLCLISVIIIMSQAFSTRSRTLINCMMFSNFAAFQQPMIRIIIGVFWWAFSVSIPRRVEQFDVYHVTKSFPVIGTAFLQ